MSQLPLRFGFHDFLNAQPLLLSLKEAEKNVMFTLYLDTPAVVADKLNAGELDLAMVPSIEYLKHANQYRLLPYFCIASRGPVETVLLIAKKDLGNIQTLALDDRSKTSVASLRLLFQDRFSPDIQFQSVHIDPQSVLETYDAALIIGDLAFQAKRRYADCDIYDLSEEWFEQTGKPFVHAVLAARNEAALPQTFLDFLETITEEGRNRIPEIARTRAASYGLKETDCQDYLQNKILYDLDDNALSGLTHFQELCIQNGLISTFQ